MPKIDFTFKILMLGSESTGKTSLSERYITGVFNPDIRLTVGVEFYVKTVEVDTDKGKKNVKLQIWDLGGEKRFRFLLPTYCLGSSGAFFLYDITRPETLEALTSWIQIVREKNNDIPIYLVGNKIDLEKERKIPKEHGAQTADMNELAGYIEVSAKMGDNVEKVFQELTDIMLKKCF
ncbi:MAG: Rab family GTPase [Promethearchaeota archaeon]